MNHILLDNNLTLIANTINLHLSYLYNVSSSINILESSIQYPLLEYMERRTHYSDISLEYKHPAFQKKRCDIFWKDENGHSCVMEMKYHKNHSTNIDYVLKDIIRLYFALDCGFSSFFLLCTQKKDTQPIINNPLDVERIKKATIENWSSNNTKSIEPYEKWLSLDTSKKTLEVKFCKENDVAYKELVESYKFVDDNKEFPDEIELKTRLVCNSQNIIIPTHQVAVWEILKA